MSTFTLLQMADPNIEQATLAQIVDTQPELWTAVLAHPNCYPGLSAHIRQHLPTLGVPQVLSQPTQFPQDQPTSVDQMAAGAKQLAAGAKEYFAHTVVPAAKCAGESLQKTAAAQINAASQANASSQQTGSTPSGVAKLTGWAPLAVPALAFVAIISLFLPVGSVSAYGYSESINFFSEEVGGEGVALLICMLLVIAGAVLAMVTGKRWVRITTGVLAALFGLLGAIDGFANMANLGNTSGVSIGAGVVLLAISSTALVVAAVLTLVTKKP